MLLTGEPGIGKSRLTAALMECLADEPHTRLRYFCSPQHTDSALYPILSQMERAAEFAHNDTAQAKLDKLDALLSRSFTPPQDRLLFAELLSLENDGRYPKLDLMPQQRRQRTFLALTTQIASLAEQRPVLMIFEDVHWIDPTSLEALGRGIDRIKSAGVLLIITHRPEFEAPWLGRPYVTSLSLNRLGEREIGAIINRVAGNDALPDNIRLDIIERTDGIPLFVEEMTKAVLEAESEGAARKTTAAILPSALAVPASLHASLMARLDRLGPAKEIAQTGAAIGREFSYALLAAVVSKPEVNLQSTLDSLMKAGVLFGQGTPPHASYLFKHALVQDAAYSTLLRDARRVLHARIGNALEREFVDVAESQPELLARHYTEAGLIEKAASLWGKAGQRSFTRSALVEAVEQLTRGLAQIATLPGTPGRRREQIKLQVALIPPLIHVKGYAAPETKAAEERARLLIEQTEALGEPLEDPLLLYSVLYGVWVASHMAFNGDVCRNLAADVWALANRQGAKIPLMVAHSINGVTFVSTGDFPESRAHLDDAFDLYDPTEHRVLAIRFGQDRGVSILSFRAWVLWFLGYPDAALTDADRAVKDAREIGQAATLLVALSCASITHRLRRSYAEASSLLDEAVALADEKGAAYWKASGKVLRGDLSALTGKASVAVQTISAGLTAMRSTGATVFIPTYLSSLARAYADLGRFDDARRSIDEALAAVQATKERMFEAEITELLAK